MGNFESEKRELDTQLNSSLYIRLKESTPLFEKVPSLWALRLSTALIVMFDNLQEDA